MSRALLELTSQRLAEELEAFLLPRLTNILRQRANGHCMRITDLDQELMVALCQGLRRDVPQAQVYILGEPQTERDMSDLVISSTRLVELRNPAEDGSLRLPLLVFVPANLRTSAEDSFGVATFEAIDVTNVYGELYDHLLHRIPGPLQGDIKGALEKLEGWAWADIVAKVRYLLTAIINDADTETLGMALYELGLVPDLKLLHDSQQASVRIRRNREKVDSLTNNSRSVRGRVLGLGLTNLTLQRRLMQLLLDLGVSEPRQWTRQIALDRKYHDLRFDHWAFTDDRYPDRIRIFDVRTDLPKVAEDEQDTRLQDLVGQQWLAPQTRRKLAVTFSVEPFPQQINGLDHFTAQIMARDDRTGDVASVVGIAKKVKAWKARRATGTVTLDKLNRVEFDEEGGWYFIRVMAWTAEGDPIPLVKSTDEGVAPQTLALPNDSEPFFVIPGEKFNEDIQQRAVPRVASLEHARLRLQCSAIREQHDPGAIQPENIAWVNVRGGAREMVNIKFSGAGMYNVPVVHRLQQLEVKMLALPDAVMDWRLTVVRGQADIVDGTRPHWPGSVADQRFLEARRHYFAAVRSEPQELISQVTDFQRLRRQIVAYAEAYRDLLLECYQAVEQSEGLERQRALAVLRMMLMIDTVAVTFTDGHGGPSHREATLVSPTHPLRALWFAAWAHIGAGWISTTREGPPEYISMVEEALLRAITPLHFPAMVVREQGSIHIDVDNINPFWAMYAPPTESDTRGLLSDVCTALDAPEPSLSGSAITGEALVLRIERYLAQHPYIRTLIINAFNPGRATIIADALVALQRQPAHADLRYDVRLFVPDPNAPSVGEALIRLLAPETAVNVDEVEAFSASTGSHLFPKLSLAIRSTDAFRENPEQFRAHLSVLLDVFPAAEVGVAPPFVQQRSAPLYGLIQDFVSRYNDQQEDSDQDEDVDRQPEIGYWFWQRQPSHGQPSQLEAASDIVALLTDLPRVISGATATVATGNPVLDNRPVITMSLDAHQRALLYRIHDMSDWVFTIDRHLGIEFFDHGRQDRPDYLIDYAPGTLTTTGHRLITTTRSLVELEAILGPVLYRYGLPAHGSQVKFLLSQLRALSGRVALKLVSSADAQRAEALGLALAYCFLNHQHALENQLIVPLDDHLSLLREPAQQEDVYGDATTLRRTDLALFDIDDTRRMLTCRLVEVKCYSQAGDLSTYVQLKDEIAQQIDASEQTLRRHFDPQLKPVDRPDRLLKTRELALLLDFYLGRAVRYRRMTSTHTATVKQFLAGLEDGYQLQFTRSALIFDFSRPGTEAPEHEHRIEFYRIGADLIRELVTAPPKDAEPSRALQETSIPVLDTAAFLSPRQPRPYLAQAPQEVIAAAPEAESPAEQMPSEAESAVEAAPAAPETHIEHKVMAAAPEAESPAEQMTSEAENAVEAAPAAPEAHIEHTEQPEEALPKPSQAPRYDIILGANRTSPQYGILGEVAGRRIALDLDSPHTISLFGVQGGGKSYTLGSIIEMACLPIPQINQLPSPLVTVLFHYSPTREYRPEFVSMVKPNTVAEQVAVLREHYKAEPHALRNIVLLAPKAQLEERRAEYPDITVLPITFSSSELKAQHWRFLMGAVGSQSLYLRQVTMIMRSLRNNLTVDSLLRGIERSTLSDHLKDLARTRLTFAAEYIDDTRQLHEVIRPGRLIIVDLRDDLVEKDEALGLFGVMLHIFSEVMPENKELNKLIVFDEAHKYIQNDELVNGLVEAVREMRHKRTSILVASQEPRSVPQSLIELSTEIILHRFNSPDWLRYIQRTNTALGNLTPENMNSLRPGEAYVWSSKASDDSFSSGAVKIRCRPRVTEHGGATKTAVLKPGE